MPAPATHDFVHLEISSASVLNTSVNGPLNYLIGRNLGSDDSIELEDSLEVLSGSNGNRYLRLPQGTTGQRPTGTAGILRFNTSDALIDFHDGTDWDQLLQATSVTFDVLNNNGDVGDAADQVAQGDHGHSWFSENLHARGSSVQHTFTSLWEPLDVNLAFEVATEGTYLLYLDWHRTIDGPYEAEWRFVDSNNGDAVIANLADTSNLNFFNAITTTIPAGARVLLQARRGGAQSSPFLLNILIGAAAYL